MSAAALDPHIFALTYLSHHLRADPSSPITFSPIHDEYAYIASMFVAPQDLEHRRHAFIAPRDSGKSTWWFLIIPLWAAAYGHRKFVAAFADSSDQAEKHLLSFKKELDENELLRNDFPGLCNPAKRPNGNAEADNSSMIITQSGFVFAAKGIDSSTLGLKIGTQRPDFIIFDDIEPTESDYSPYQAKKRLGTVQDAILPMSLRATVIFCGTVTMPGSIMHQLVLSTKAGGAQALEPAQWIKDEKINVHYFPPFDPRSDQPLSIWPEKWDTDYLLSIVHTRSFQKNFKNLPVPTDGEYWQEEDFQYQLPPQYIIHKTILAVDPATTTKKTSDFTAFAIISFISYPIGAKRRRACIVQRVAQAKAKGERLKELANRLIDFSMETTHPISKIYIEVNQGGDLWKDNVFTEMPVPVEVMTNSVKKEIRAAALLAYYQKRLIFHGRPADPAGRATLAILEEQQTAYPNVMHDDLIDAVGIGVHFFVKKRPSTAISNVSYM